MLTMQPTPPHTSTEAILRLLEPGALLGGALFRSLLWRTERRLELPEGQRLGAFAVAQEIGRGGMGVVYLGNRVEGEFQQQVAIKCIDAAQSESRLALFRHERQLLASLKHPHIARLIDAGSARLAAHAEEVRDARANTDVLWFAMELVEGKAIDQHVQTMPSNIVPRLQLIQQLASALSAAHGRSLVHRDVTPNNVMIDADGTAKLLDFGIAGFAADAKGTLAYSPRWASPEQMQFAPTGPASDQFQLGNLLRLVMLDATNRNIVSGRRGAELEAIVARACAQSPEQRYGSVTDMNHDIQRWINGMPVNAAGTGLGYGLRCAVSRHPWITFVGTAILLLAIASALWFKQRLQIERDLATAQAERALATKNYLLSLFQDGDPTRGTDPNLTARELIRAGVQRIETDRELPSAVRAELLNLMVEIQLRLGDASTAKRLLSASGSAGNTNTDTSLWGARIAILEGKPDEALLALKALYQTTPSANLAVMLARAELDAGQTQQAEQRINALLASKQLNGTHTSSALLTRGVLEIRTGRPLAAIASNQQALQAIAYATPSVSPVPAYINTALAEIDLARFDSALKNLAHAEQSLVNFPNQRNQFLVLQNRGMALYRSGDVQAAEAVWLDLQARAGHGVNLGIEAASLHNLAAIADAKDDPVRAIEYSSKAALLREQLGDLPGVLSSKINIAVKLGTIGLHQEAMALSQHIVTQATAMRRSDLASRAAFNAATSQCQTRPAGCTSILAEVVRQFIKQNNVVKAIEALEKLVDYSCLSGAPMISALAQTRTLTNELRLVSGTDADVANQLQELLPWLQAIELNDTCLLNASSNTALNLAQAKGGVRQLVLVQMALNRGQTELAQQLLARFSLQREDYWRLKRQVAQRLGDSAAAQQAVRDLASLQEKALAVFQRQGLSME